MSTAVKRARRLQLGPLSAGMLLTAKEFDRARFEVSETAETFVAFRSAKGCAFAERKPTIKPGSVHRFFCDPT
jgi:hypothetical protein